MLQWTGASSLSKRILWVAGEGEAPGERAYLRTAKCGKRGL